MDSFAAIRFPALVTAGQTVERPRAALAETNLEDQRKLKPAPKHKLLHGESSAVSSSQESDEELLSFVCAGNTEALASLFRRYARIVRGVAYRVLRDASEADDLLQDIFILVSRKCGMFDPSRGPARFWILQMTYHRALARRRYLNSRHFYTRVNLDDAVHHVREPTIGSNGHGFSGDALLARTGWIAIFDNLSHDQRETLRLFFVEGYTLGEIAAKLNQTRSNIKHHYFRGLERLRKQLFLAN